MLLIGRDGKLSPNENCCDFRPGLSGIEFTPAAINRFTLHRSTTSGAFELFRLTVVVVPVGNDVETIKTSRKCNNCDADSDDLFTTSRQKELFVDEQSLHKSNQ